MKTKNVSAESLMEIVREVQNEYQYVFKPEELIDIVMISRTKLVLNQKNVDYLPILLRNELIDFLTRQEINAYSAKRKAEKEVLHGSV